MERVIIPDVEDFFTAFFKTIGGQPVQEYIGSVPDFENADYYFKDDNVLIELKCLEKDLFSDDDIERNERLFDKWIAEKKLKKVDIIPILLRKKRIPDECLFEIYELARRTLTKVFEKGNKQLKITKHQLGNEKTQLVLIICNNGNYLFHNQMLMEMLWEILTTREALSIDSLIYCTINQSSYLPENDKDYQVWVPTYSENAREGLSDFVDNLYRNLAPYYFNQTGIKSPDIREYSDRAEGINAISKMKFVQKEIIFKKK